MLVIPHRLRWTGSVEEQNVGRYLGVRSEDAVRQPHDGVEVVVCQQLFLDSRADARSEQSAVGHDNAGSSSESTAMTRTTQLPHNQLKKQQGRLGRLAVFREVPLYSLLFLTAKWRV